MAGKSKGSRSSPEARGAPVFARAASISGGVPKFSALSVLQMVSGGWCRVAAAGCGHKAALLEVMNQNRQLADCQKQGKSSSGRILFPEGGHICLAGVNPMTELLSLVPEGKQNQVDPCRQRQYHSCC